MHVPSLFFIIIWPTAGANWGLGGLAPGVAYEALVLLPVVIGLELQDDGAGGELQVRRPVGPSGAAEAEASQQ